MDKADATLNLVKRITSFDGSVKLYPESNNQANLLCMSASATRALYYIAADEDDISIEAYVVVSKHGHTFFNPNGRDCLVVVCDNITHTNYERTNLPRDEMLATYEQIIQHYNIESKLVNPDAITAIENFCAHS